MSRRKRVTQGEFDQITCNRCGACCETLWLPSPLRLAELRDAPPQPRSAPREWMLENQRFVGWLSALEPTGKVVENAPPGATHEYHCTRHTYDSDGLAFCTAYGDRPSVCRDFPYGRPVNAEDYPDCSWNVDVFQLQAGEVYCGTRGQYVVLWRAGPSLYVRFEDGSEATLDAETETRAVLDLMVELESFCAGGVHEDVDRQWARSMGRLARTAKLRVELPVDGLVRFARHYRQLTGQTPATSGSGDQMTVRAEGGFGPEMIVDTTEGDGLVLGSFCPHVYLRTGAMTGQVSIHNNLFAYKLLEHGFVLGAKQEAQRIRARIPDWLREEFDAGLAWRP